MWTAKVFSIVKVCCGDNEPTATTHQWEVLEEPQGKTPLQIREGPMKYAGMASRVPNFSKSAGVYPDVM